MENGNTIISPKEVDYMIAVQVSGGVTGTRSSYLKENGEIWIGTREEAAQRAADYMLDMNHSGAGACFNAFIVPRFRGPWLPALERLDRMETLAWQNFLSGLQDEGIDPIGDLTEDFEEWLRREEEGKSPGEGILALRATLRAEGVLF